MKYIAYVRRSTTDKKKQIQSIPNQLDWTKRTAREFNVKIEETFIDKKSATKPGRDGFNAMMEYVNDSIEPIGILVWKMSRLARNPIDEGAIKYAFMIGKINHIYSIDRQFKTGENQILLGVEFGAATQSSIELSTSVKFGMRRKLKSGYRPTSVPLGYLNDPRGLKGEKKIFIDPKRFDILQTAWKKLISGAYSVEMIRLHLNDIGFKTRSGRSIPKSTLYDIFSNPFYSGWFKWCGELYKGKHTPMISKKEFDRVQILLGKKSGKPSTTKEGSIYNGLLTCGECGFAITTDCIKKRIKKTNELKEYNYLKCTKKNKDHQCKQSQSKQYEIESQILEVLSTIELPKKVSLWFTQCMINNLKENKSKITGASSQIQRQLKDNEILIERLVDNLNKGIINAIQFEKTMSRYRKISNGLNQELEELKNSNLNWEEDILNSFTFTNMIQTKFTKGDKNTKREIISQIGSNWTLYNKNLLLELHPIYLVIQKVQKQLKLEFPWFEPENCESRRSETIDGLIESPIWRSLMEEVRTIYGLN